MQTSTSIIFLLYYLVAYMVSASPTILKGLYPTTQNVSAIPTVTLHVDLPPPPDGPSDFDIGIGHPYTALHREDFYMFAIKVLMQNALEDFHGLLDEPRKVFRDPKYPHLAIAAAGLQPGQRLPRRYLLWGIARSMDFMVAGEEFFERTFSLRSGGVNVGELTWMNPDLDHSPASNKTSTALLKTQSMNSSMSTGGVENQLTWKYRPFGHLLPVADVMMGTVASLIQAAQLPDENVTTFIGYWPRRNYKAWQSWHSMDWPSPFTKAMLVTSIRAAAVYAHVHANFHELLIEVGFDYQRVIASGGYSKLNPLPLEGHPRLGTGAA